MIKILSERNDFVHFYIIRLRWHFIDKLEIEADSYSLDIQVFTEESVVIATSAADAVAVAVKSDAWDDDEVVVAGVRLVLRFEDIEIADGEACIFGKFNRDYVIADHGREDDFLFMAPFLEEGLSLNFIWQSAVNHHNMRFLEIRMLLEL